MRHVHILVVAVLLTLAGCGSVGIGDGFGGGAGADEANTVNPALTGTPTRSPTLTQSPSPTPTAVPTPTVTPTLAESLPPSLTTTSADPLLLAGAHEQGLSGASRTIVQTISVRSLNGTVVAHSRIRLEDDGRGRIGRLAVEQTVTGSNPRSVGFIPENVTYWGNASVTVSRVVDPNGSVSYTFDRTEFPPIARSDTTGEGAVAFAFRIANLTAVERIAVDPAVFRVRGAAAFSPTYEARNVTLTGTVTASGVVRSFQVSYVRERGGRLRSITRTFRVADVGETNVDRPSWYEAAARSSASNATTTG